MNRLPLFVAMLGCLYGAPALAQEATETETETSATEAAQASDSQPTELDKITVTGSLLRRVEYDSISPVQVITADSAVEIGQVDAGEFLQQSSVAAGSTQINNQFGGFVVEGGLGVQTVGLRGLGAQRTLVLMDGKRPGPSGTRGQVQAFDLSVLPTSVIQRVEILKDGASSIYGSDAVAGVANYITRRNIDRPEIFVQGRMPFDGGGETFGVSAATGWNFDNSNIVIGAEWQKYEPLKVGDRDYFNCPRDLVRDADGNIIDREDRSITAGTSLGGCNNLYANTVIDALFGTRYVPSPDGTTVGMIPGYRPRANGRYDDANGEAFYEDVLNYDFYKNQYILNESERFKFYGSASVAFDSINWDTQVMASRRETSSERFRQFFPLVGGATALIPGYSYANDPTYAAPVDSGIAQPVIPFRSNNSEKIDYYYLTTGLNGIFSSTDTWSWQANLSYTYSDGDYTGLGIVASRSGDVQFDDDAPVLDYFSPGVLSGENMDELEAQIGQYNTGNTVYDQLVFTGIATGDLFELPAGPVASAFGVEYRDFSIDDQPSELSQNGDLWGQSSAQVTKGDDHVTELFMEVEAPLLAGIPGIESLTVNASARWFDYASVDDSDYVWKTGLSWQVTPSFRMRATTGTSYRAPGLYELYLGNQTGFLSQLNIDPCIDWANSNNATLAANCAAAGIPGDYAGGASSATVVSGGGAGVLDPETSEASTVGIVFTPQFADFSIALDYFSIEVNDQIGQLGAGAILGGCYGSPNYPNAFCDLFDRNPTNDPTAPHAITEVRDSYININKQRTRGYDLLVRYENEFPAGKLDVQGEATYVFEDFQQLFDPDQASGFDTDDFNGDIGRPKVVANLRTAFERNDWTYTWFMNYVHGTSALGEDVVAPYFGFPGGGYRDVTAERAVYHGFSVRYDQPDWSILVGVRNIFDQDPPTISGGINRSVYGNVPAFATQYDWYGRTGYIQFNYKF
ncbi:TonB-dependent receptor domain-containing protein [Marilutibacter spongiae]|uniref:TonB-dependent receptor n=1 Tax=Marilutibacter spongiae TaxID=2025720 RepID=A0A7W3Y5X6_9GAMM|nr:TonB-dependent receptor [Lysobacter spongiae]MBB1060647.1 TonB-dependent receptor [Lysobacter spongiae]